MHFAFTAFTMNIQEKYRCCVLPPEAGNIDTISAIRHDVLFYFEGQRYLYSLSLEEAIFKQQLCLSWIFLVNTVVVDVV